MPSPARVMKERGHDVTVYEARSEGGLLHEAAAPEFKSDIRPFMEYQITALKKLGGSFASVGCVEEG